MGKNTVKSIIVSCTGFGILFWDVQLLPRWHEAAMCEAAKHHVCRCVLPNMCESVNGSKEHHSVPLTNLNEQEDTVASTPRKFLMSSKPFSWINAPQGAA